MVSIAGKVALVTGGSKGMGRHFVRELASEGVRVAVLARKSAELESLTREVSGEVLAIPCDVTSPVDVQAAIAQTLEQFGQLNIVVNNAAIYTPFEFEEAPEELIRRYVEINILGVIWVTRAAIPHLRNSKGHIVNISSESVRLPFPMLALYGGTKAAVETISQALRDEFREDGIRVTVLRSGTVSGGAGGPTSPELAQRFFQKIAASGHAAFCGTPAMPQSMAKSLVAVLSLPHDVSVDLVEVRAVRAGAPEGAINASRASTAR